MKLKWEHYTMWSGVKRYVAKVGSKTYQIGVGSSGFARLVYYSGKGGAGRDYGWLPSLEAAKDKAQWHADKYARNPISSQMRTAAWVGGGLVLALGLFAFSKRASAASLASPEIPIGVTKWTQVQTITPGPQQYEVTVLVPTQVSTTAAEIASVFTSVGWTGQVIYAPGDPASKYPNEMAAVLPLAANIYVFQGTYNGASPSPVVAGKTVALVAS